MDGTDPNANAGDGEEEAAPRFTDDIILEFLSRLPVKPLHRFKCVSRHWLGLISHPDRQSRLPQTLAGFVYIGYTPGAVHQKSLHFATAQDDGPPPLIDPSALSAAPSCFEYIHRVDCSNGLLLLHACVPLRKRETAHSYTVCNPATEEYSAVPVSPTRGIASFVRLAVDPAATAPNSPLHFRIFEFRCGRPGMKSIVLSAEIYSSESGTWTHRQCGWDFGDGISLRDQTSGAVFGGMLYLAPIKPVLVSVDLDGNTWKTRPKPSSPDDDGFFGGPAPGSVAVSRGRLHFLNTLEYDELKLCDWELDEDTGAWVMKHSVDLRKLFTAGRWSFGIGDKFSVIGVHPDRNVVYFLKGEDNTLISCAVDRGEGRVLRDLGYNNYVPYVPYVPRFQGPLATRAPEN